KQVSPREKRRRQRDQSTDDQSHLQQFESLHDGKTGDGETRDCGDCRPRGSPSERDQPERDTRNGKQKKKPEESSLDRRERQCDRGREKEHDVDRIGKALLVGGIAGTVQWTAVESGLDLSRNFRTVGIAPVE